MDSENMKLPWLWYVLCLWCTQLSLGISLYGIIQHFRNYRKPFEQRLTVRIMLIIPLFSITCLIGVINPYFAQLVTDPIREVYEAFIIFTFFSLLTLVLGGERHIITVISLSHEPTKHPIIILGRFLKPIDLSDPEDFLMVKKGILQYVWFKPIYCIGILILQFWESSRIKLLLVLLYNLSMTWSLYNLALFWKSLSSDLKPFHPWSKFLCVKLIIFASYWQGIGIQMLAFIGIINHKDDGNNSFLDPAYQYQNGLLCIEMLFFAIFHLIAFPWLPYSSKKIPTSSRMRFLYAIRDCFLGYDIKWDFKHTLWIGSSYYTYQNFDTREIDGSLIATMRSQSRNRQLHKGIRFSNNGKSKYWVGDYGSIPEAVPNEAIHEGQKKTLSRDSTQSEFNELLTDEYLVAEWDDSISKQRYIPADPNYPVVWDINGYRYTGNMDRIRFEIEGSI